MNNIRKVLRCLYDQPWQTVDQLATKMNLSRLAVSRMIKKDLNLRCEDETDSDGNVNKIYALPVPKNADVPPKQ